MAGGVKAGSFVKMVCGGALSVCHDVAALGAVPQGRSLCDMHDEPEARYIARLHMHDLKGHDHKTDERAHDGEAQAFDWHHVAADMKNAFKYAQQKR